MMDSTSPRKKKKLYESFLAVALWILLWGCASLAINQEMFLPSPGLVVRTLFSLLPTASFWSSILFSMSRMGLGFLLAFFLGNFLSAAAYRFRPIEIFLAPFMGTIRAAPVASYIILCLLLMPSSYLSVVISLTMALPIIYTSTLSGLFHTDKKLLEMAKVFEISALKRAFYIYLSELMPFLLSGSSVALGLCWKSGIAAEVIGMPVGSIGEKFYMAKVFVDTKSVLAWTAVVILLSFLFERVFLSLLKKLSSAVERM